MKRAWILLFSVSGFFLWACGGKVAFDGLPGGGTTSSASSSSSSSSGAANACPSMPNDAEVQALVGKSCNQKDAVCASNNGCGGCSITCVGGTWTSTNVMLCFSVGGTC